MNTTSWTGEKVKQNEEQTKPASNELKYQNFRLPKFGEFGAEIGNDVCQILRTHLVLH